MKKFIFPFALLAVISLLVACAHRQPSAYNREDEDQSYERFINSHIFAACNDIGQPYVTYSLAYLNKRPEKDNPYYKVTFFNGPCKGKVLWTKDVILKTEPVENGFLQLGAVVLRNYHNPQKPEDKSQTDRWHKGVVLSTQRQKDGIIELGFPRDRNDFNPARESVYLHNIRYITEPTVKDVRNFL